MRYSDYTAEITNEFLECFATKEDCKGVMARMICMMELPQGVDPNNAKVKQVVKWCLENIQEQPHPERTDKP